MKIKSLSSGFLSAALLAFLCSCDEKEPEAEPQTSMTSESAAVFVGSTVQVFESSDQLNGYRRRDTVYADTFRVEQYMPDSIRFRNKGRSWTFKSSSTNRYEEWYGTHSSSTFETGASDSLRYSFWIYGGNGTNFNKETKEFAGRKQ